MHLFGIQENLTPEYLTGTWISSDEFFKWGITDKEKSKVKSFKGRAVMTLEKEGIITMKNLFRPELGKWEITGDSIVIHDPKFPERGFQVLPIRKRDDKRMWVLLPFTGGAAGIGMVKISDDTVEVPSADPALAPGKKAPGRAARKGDGYTRTRQIRESDPDQIIRLGPD
jgi:hypothetical protein